jgi:hypothetical protein
LTRSEGERDSASTIAPTADRSPRPERAKAREVEEETDRVEPSRARDKDGKRKPPVKGEELQTKEEKVLAVIRTFILDQVKDPTGFEVLDQTKPLPLTGANGKPADLMRVVFRAKETSGNLSLEDFLFVVEQQQVIEHARTADFVAAEAAQRAALLRLARLNDAVLRQQAQQLARAGTMNAAGRGAAPYGAAGGGHHLGAQAGWNRHAGGVHPVVGRAGAGLGGQGHQCILGH